MTYRIVTEQELSVRKGEIVLSLDEMAEIISFKNSFYKFIDKTKIELMLSLATGRHKGKEQHIYDKVEWLEELKQSIEKTEENMRIYKKKTEQ